MSVLLNSTPQLMSSLAPLLPGTAGLCQALAAMMSIDQTPDEAMHWQQLWCVSSGALSQYVYDYQINPAYDPERYFSKAGQLFSNWGLFEALGYYTGWEIKEFNHISQQDYWALLSFELSEGRPVLTIGLDGSLGDGQRAGRLRGVLELARRRSPWRALTVERLLNQAAPARAALGHPARATHQGVLPRDARELRPRSAWLRARKRPDRAGAHGPWRPRVLA